MKNPFSFQESHKLWIDCNDRPEIPGGDFATFARLHSIPCLIAIPREEMDRELIIKLREERAGILAWAVRGAIEWHQHGLPRPDQVAKATDTWREECDQIRMFIQARCVLGDAFCVYAEKLLRALLHKVVRRLQRRGDFGDCLWIAPGPGVQEGAQGAWRPIPRHRTPR